MAREVEIIYTGLSVFLNLEDKNKTMGDPGVILVRTGTHSHGHDLGTSHNHGGGGTPHDEHIPFIAYNRHTTDVTNTSGANWLTVPGASDYMYLALNGDGVELSIAEDDRKGPLKVHSSYYDQVVKKDDYWPAVKNQWNRAYVPEKGKKPSSMVVAAYMRLHTGNIAPGNLTAQKWKFLVDNDPNKPPLDQKFAFDVVYSSVPNADGTISIIETCLDCGHFEREHRFLPKRNVQKITLFIGNNTLKDMNFAVTRKQSRNVARGAHFVFINKIADATYGSGEGPIPTPPPATVGPVGDLGAGGTDGYCGPANGNN